MGTCSTGSGTRASTWPGRDPEVGLFLRQARSRGMTFQLVTGDNNITESFRMIAGGATEGTLLTSYPDPRERPEAAELETSKNLGESDVI